MRLRDLRLYSIIGFFIFAVVLLFDVYYIQGVRGRITELACEDARTTTRICEMNMEETIRDLQYELDHFDYSRVSVVSNPKEQAFNYFDSNFVIKSEQDMEIDGKDQFYLYLLSNNRNIGKVEINKVFSKGFENAKYFLYNPTTGDMYDSNVIDVSFYSFVKANGFEEIDEIKQSIKTDNKFTIKIKINNDKYFLTGIKVSDDIYFSQLLGTHDYLVKIKSLDILGLIFIIIIALATIAIITVSALILKKQNALINLSKRSASRNDSLLIRAKKNGVIISTNHKIKEFDDNPNLLKNIFDFKTVDGSLLKNSLKNEERKICFFEIGENKTYFDFAIFRYNFTYYLLGINITKKYQDMQALENLTSKNHITQLPNYYKFFSDFDGFISLNSNKVLSFVMINIVEFEEIKNLFGIETINQVCIETSSKIISCVGKNHLYHTSDDTFVFVLSSAVKEENNKIIAKVVKLLHETLQVKTNTLYVKYKYASYETLNSNNDTITFDDIYRKLTVTMDRTKASVTKEYMKYDINIQNYVNHIERMQEDLVRAVENQEFMMYYQPQYDLYDNRIAGFEALIRWNNPDYINISPQEYIELAERNGYIIDIGNFIIRDVFKTAKIFEPYDVHISINVSPAQLFQAGFTGFLLDEFEKNKLKKGSIAIEITETFLMENFGVIIEKLKLLRSKGFTIHLDDFGTGYSSLQYLKELPIDTIKTDKEFIRNIQGDKTSQLILKGIISMAKSIDLKVISEGVETKEQAEILKKCGSDYLQGYLISKAVSLSDAIDMVKNGVNIFEKKGHE